MNQYKKIGKTVGVVLILFVLSLLSIINTTDATQINTAYIYATHDCGALLKYKGITVKTDYVQYDNDGKSYPSYCLDKTKPGAGVTPYTVSIKETIKDVELWKIIIHGYPYKSIQELGVANKEEAFTATKQAVYCHIHENQVEDYEAIGEAGERTLQALKNILINAAQSKETQIPKTIKVNKNQDNWKQDEIKTEYVSKTYTIDKTNLGDTFDVAIDKADEAKGIIIADKNSNSKNKFGKNESFKVLIPIKTITEQVHFKLNITAKIKTKPVLFGEESTGSYQDYALTAATYEDGTGVLEDETITNETKIIVQKKDEKTGDTLEGVTFTLYNDKKEVVQENLVTNKEGKIIIQNVMPGTYYLKEVKTKPGYVLLQEEIEIKIGLNEEQTIIVNNKQEEKPKVVIEKKAEIKPVKRLPVTGK